MCLIKGEPMCKGCIDKEWEKNRPKPIPPINRRHLHTPVVEMVMPQLPSTSNATPDYNPSINMFLLSMVRKNEAKIEQLRKENEEIRTFVNNIK